MDEYEKRWEEKMRSFPDDCRFWARIAFWAAVVSLVVSAVLLLVGQVGAAFLAACLSVYFVISSLGSRFLATRVIEKNDESDASDQELPTQANGE